MKKSFRPIILIFCLLAGILLLCKAPVQTQAASVDYQYHSSVTAWKKAKYGKYYIWMETKDGLPIRLKSAKSMTGKATTLASAPKNGFLLGSFVTNGKKVFYTVTDTTKHKTSIVGVTISTKQKVTYKTASSDKVHMLPMHVYGNTLYYSQSSGSYPNLKESIMRMDLKKKKAKTLKSQYNCYGGDGRYLYTGQYLAGRAAAKQYIYDCKTGKSRLLVKSLSIPRPYLYKGKLYVAATCDSIMTVYRFSASGTGKKLLKSIPVNKGSSDTFYNGYLYYITIDTEPHHYRMRLSDQKIQALTPEKYMNLLGY